MYVQSSLTNNYIMHCTHKMLMYRKWVVVIQDQEAGFDPGGGFGGQGEGGGRRGEG